jgi:phosphoserine phosphatase RsbU/P
MSSVEPAVPLQSTLAPGLMSRALEVLAEATDATAVLTNAAGELVAGPVPGSALGRLLLSTEAGRSAVISAHLITAKITRGGLPESDGSPLAEALYRVAVPIMTDGKCAGTLTLGDRPRRALSTGGVRKIAAACGLDPELLQAAAGELPAWSPAAASAARNLATLIADLFAELCTQEKTLQDRLDELSAVYNIVGMLAGTTDLQEILNKTTQMVCEVMKVKACSIRLLDPISGALNVSAVHNLSDKYIQKGPVTVDENPIDRAALEGEMLRIVDVPTDPRTRYPEQAREEGIVSGLICGLIYRGKAVGVLRVYTGEPHVFSPFEEALLRSVAAQAAAAIINARLVKETIEAERYARQIAYAGQVQRRMIPSSPPKHAHVEIGAVYRPTYNVGGDFYDFICLPKGNLGVSIADVSGKGVPASLLMASIRSAMRVYAYFTYDIDRILVEVNKHVCRETTVGEFATVFYGVVTPDGRRLTYCNAGHEPPILLRGGKTKYLETGGMVVGVDPETQFERGVLQLQPGDALLLSTDGVPEALNFHDECFGRERLVQSFQRHADQPAQHAVQGILWDLRRFRGLADRTDDVTMVLLKIK